MLPTFTVSLAGSAAMSLQGGVEAADQGRSGEGLGQEANCSGLQHSRADAFFGEGRDENERHTGTLGTLALRNPTALHARNLTTRNPPRRVIQVGRPQELLGR